MKTSALRFRASIVVAGMLAAAVAQMTGAAPVGAAGVLECQISMQLAMKPVPLTQRFEFSVLSGGGSCTADGNGSYIAQVLAGSGSSKGFGPGSDCPSEETRAFSLDVSLSLTSTSSGTVSNVAETFGAPGVIALPGTAAVVVTSPGKTDGAGDFSYRIYHQCPPGGEQSALFIGTLAN